MSDKKYTLDPCGACQKRFIDPVDMANCCYTTMGAFTGMTNSVNMKDVEPCQACTNKAVCAEKRGKTPCNRRIPRPLLRIENNYYPKLLEETRDKDQALHKCVEMCGNDKDCRMRCILHNDSVIVDNNDDISDNKESFQVPESNMTVKYSILGVLAILFLVILIKMK